jgi:hypothetical protein
MGVFMLGVVAGLAIAMLIVEIDKIDGGDL